SLNQENQNSRSFHINPCKARCFWVAADREGVSSEEGLVQHNAKNEEADQGDPDWQRDPKERCPSEHNEIDIGNTDRLSVRGDEPQPAYDLHRGKRRD